MGFSGIVIQCKHWSCSSNDDFFFKFELLMLKLLKKCLWYNFELDSHKSFMYNVNDNITKIEPHILTEILALVFTKCNKPVFMNGFRRNESIFLCTQVWLNHPNLKVKASCKPTRGFYNITIIFFRKKKVLVHFYQLG